jgi:hypothetical protein
MARQRLVAVTGKLRGSNWIKNAGSKMLDQKCWIKNAGSKMLDQKCWIKNARSKMSQQRLVTDEAPRR